MTIKSIATSLLTIQKSIATFEEKYVRPPGSVQLLAVSKHQSIDKIRAAYQAGQRTFGENYLQEALPKIAVFADEPLEWHFIGSIQSNKTRKIAEHFSWVHTIENINIAKRLNDQRPAHLPPLNICIEVNISHEPTKAGVATEKVFALAEECLLLPNLSLRGLMIIPEPLDDFTLQRQLFHHLFLLWQSLREKNMPLDTLSMGMSNDFEAAIAEGATIIRVGTAIFGERSS